MLFQLLWSYDLTVLYKSIIIIVIVIITIIDVADAVQCFWCTL